MKEKIQLNARINKDLRKAHKLATDYAESNLEETTEAALLYFYGSTDQKVVTLRGRLMDAVAQLEKGCNLAVLRGTSCATLLRALVGASRTSRT